MCHVSLLDYPALPPLEDFNFNCFYFFLDFIIAFIFFSFIFISWRLITLQYCFIELNILKSMNMTLTLKQNR